MASYPGLNDEEVRERVENRLVNKTKDYSRSFKEIIFSNVFTYFNLINIVLLALIIIVKEYKNGLFIFTIIFNTLIGLYQEIKAKLILDKLKIINQDKVTVIRNNSEALINSNEIVKDDLLILKQGYQAVADMIIIDGELEVNEALLTGESESISKKINDEILSGSLIISGEAVAKVIKVGNESYANQLIIKAKAYKANKSRLKIFIDSILKIVSVIIIPVGILLFYNDYNHISFVLSQTIVSIVASMIGMIPEGLIFLISMALAVSAVRLAKNKVLIQELDCIETLARVDTICFDKTGTITNEEMEVIEVINLSDDDINKIMGNFIRVFKASNKTGLALQKYFKIDNSLKEKKIIYFSSERKYSAINFEDNFTYYLGAYQKLGGNDKIKELILNYTSKGYRVLSLCKADSIFKENEVVDNLKVMALIILKDTLRENAYEIMQYFKNQGVKIKIISGDDPITVSNLAKEVGIEGYEKHLDLSLMDIDDLDKHVEDKVIFARVSPLQKQLIIKSLQNRQHVVAMSGDGINDVLALRQADVGISIFSADQGAKNVSEIILMNDDFSSMCNIVNEGRRVINNINKAVSMFLIKTFFSIILSVLAIAFNFKYPFISIQLTIISAFCVGIPTALLQLENDFNIVKENFFKNIIYNALPSAIIIVLGVLAIKLFNDKQTLMFLYTAFIYGYSLINVYGFNSLYKKFIITLNLAFMGLTMYIFHDFLELGMIYDYEMILLLTLIFTGALCKRIIKNKLNKYN